MYSIFKIINFINTMRIKFPTLLFIGMTNMLSAQCYIQYYYNLFGNTTYREYIGSGRPAETGTKNIMALNAVSLWSDQFRAERVQKDFNHQVKTYPNPAQSRLTMETTNSDNVWSYKLTSMNGQILISESLPSNKLILELNHLPSAAYKFTVFDQNGKIVNHTIIVKT